MTNKGETVEFNVVNMFIDYIHPETILLLLSMDISDPNS